MFASGLWCGLSSFGAGIAIWIAVNADVRALALGLYGLIVSLILSSA